MIETIICAGGRGRTALQGRDRRRAQMALTVVAINEAMVAALIRFYVHAATSYGRYFRESA